MSSSTRFLRCLYKHDIGGKIVLDRLNQAAAPERKRLGCTVTGYKRSLNRKWKLGRHAFRKMALDGKLHGVHKASW